LVIFLLILHPAILEFAAAPKSPQDQTST